MSDLIRLSLSINKSLNRQLEKLIKESGYANRSEFIRDMIRDRLVEKKWDGDREVIGTITLVYNHHVRHLSEKLTHLQHDHYHEVLATTHVHLDKNICAEMILVRSRPQNIRKIADKLKQQKGVLHAELSMSVLGQDLN